MRTPVLEQDVATVEVLMPDGTCTSAQVSEGEASMDPLAQAELVAAAVARRHPKAVVKVEGNRAARELAARRIDRFDLLGRPRCTCPKMYRLFTFFSGKDYRPRDFLQDSCTRQADCPHHGYHPEVS